MYIVQQLGPFLDCHALCDYFALGPFLNHEITFFICDVWQWWSWWWCLSWLVVAMNLLHLSWSWWWASLVFLLVSYSLVLYLIMIFHNSLILNHLLIVLLFMIVLMLVFFFITILFVIMMIFVITLVLVIFMLMMFFLITLMLFTRDVFCDHLGVGFFLIVCSLKFPQCWSSSWSWCFSWSP